MVNVLKGACELEICMNVCMNEFRVDPGLSDSVVSAHITKCSRESPCLATQ